MPATKGGPPDTNADDGKTPGNNAGSDDAVVLFLRRQKISAIHPRTNARLIEPGRSLVRFWLLFDRRACTSLNWIISRFFKAPENSGCYESRSLNKL